MEKEYISIREFASRANISRQRAYKLVSKKLQGYCKIIGDKKIIDISALDELKKTVDNGHPVDKCTGNNCNPVDNSKKVSLQQNLDSADDFNYAVGLDGVSVTGEGTIDGNGRKTWEAFWPQRRKSSKFHSLNLLQIHKRCMLAPYKSTLNQKLPNKVRVQPGQAGGSGIGYSGNAIKKEVVPRLLHLFLHYPLVFS